MGDEGRVDAGRESEPSGEYAIVAEGLGRKFRRKWAVKDLDLKVPRGSVFGFLGPNGAGKSTTIHMLMGLLPRTEGRMEVFGLDPKKQDVAIKRRVGYVPEHHGYYEWMRVDETIDLVSVYHKDWDYELSNTLKQDFRLEGDQKIKELSKGARAKLALLLALSFKPDMLILDEPTGGLDPAARRSFLESILGRYQEEGKTIFVSSHLINEFSGLLDHVAFIKDGSIQLAMRTDDLHANIKRARLIFDDGVPSAFSLPNLLRAKTNGREAVLTLRDYNEERTIAELKQTGARDIQIENMSLEDIFVELVGYDV